MDLTNAVLQGVLLGGLYAIFATGLSLVFGVMRIVNLAHGDFATLAAFVALVLVTGVGLPVWATLLVVVPVLALLGYAVQRLLLQRALSPSPLPVLLVTFALSIVIQNGLLEVFSSDQNRLRLGRLDTASLHVGAFALGVYPLLVFVVAVLILAGLALFLSRTRTGRAMRATSDDREAAQLAGVDHRHVYGVATALAFATVAVAGVLSGAQTSFTPSSGPSLLIFAFEVVIIGGLGNLWGSLAGGIVLGVAQNVGAWVDPAQQVLAGHLVFLLVLALRPQGLFGRAVPA
ncbi:branched-chain amino acid ABC transporter permease [Nocardioides mangrovicus]|uniref:Branched-chain amino acid ABC transporter permease n=1 Tax=Nocardioides mangrovicus TaxID=2478913 RepID=A0A3L8P8D1_9ACTN|nr:branched-chain amino acid ABC transporter permease [Nocardioides mangrovicus]RLV50959.1 branched-chain amino acid ABC transporter permease [Nocardioides mangrovicus]